MKKDNYQISINVHDSAQKSFENICAVTEWWGSDVKGSANKLNNVFTICFGETFVEFKITEFKPYFTIVWQVTNSYLPWLRDKSEWTNTNVEWKLSEKNNQTKIIMTHIGLTPVVECYSNCEKGWNFYTGISLPKLINEGKGLPDTPHKERTKV